MRLQAVRSVTLLKNRAVTFTGYRILRRTLFKMLELGILKEFSQ